MRYRVYCITKAGFESCLSTLRDLLGPPGRQEAFMIAYRWKRTHPDHALRITAMPDGGTAEEIHRIGFEERWSD